MNLACAPFSADQLLAAERPEGGSNILLVGLGPHARRTYATHLLEQGRRYTARLSAIVELASVRPATEAFCRERGISAERVYVEPFTAREMPAEVWARLDTLVVGHRINAMICSTEPLAHHTYLEYGLRRGLNVLTDKPLTTRRSVADDLDQARGIWSDYRDILTLYHRLQAYRRTCLLVNSQRRYHPGFRKALELVAEIRDRFGCPLTYLSSSHCDGQWRLPAEIIGQVYHPYHSGYGKISHSGYHVLDMVACFLRAGALPGKSPDTLALTSSFVLPAGFFRQLNRDDYRRFFGATYDEVCLPSDDELREQVVGFGEVDASALVELRLHGDVVGQAKINLRHNGFSRRSWVRPGTDLYKGNGRVRHERHEIVSGPLQTVYIDSYQANDRHEHSGPEDARCGGNNHFTITCFRNNAVTGDREPMQVLHLSDLPGASGFDPSRLHNEQAKVALLVEFLRFLRGEVQRDQLRSNIDDHDLTARLMSMMYESHALRRRGGREWVAVALAPVDPNSADLRPGINSGPGGQQ
jgi:predicted dehydrogenase